MTATHRFWRTDRPNRQGGFTLIEVMVAISLMALIAVVSWRGIDGILRAQSFTAERAQQHAVLQTALAQWHADLDQIAPLVALPSLDWDGKVLRITRTSSRTSVQDAPALRVVAWSERSIGGQRHWLRWQSRPLQSRQQWVQAWAAATLWSQGQSATDHGDEVVLMPIVDWQLYYARDGRWSNPQSSSQLQDSLATGGLNQPFAVATSPADSTAGDDDAGEGSDAVRYASPSDLLPAPDAIRLQLHLAAAAGLSGRITRDWLNPAFGSAR